MSAFSIVVGSATRLLADGSWGIGPVVILAADGLEYDEVMAPEDARELGAALIAAADEAGSRGPA